MTTIDSPVDASTNNANPQTAVGTGAGDFVQVRLERSDGAVYDGTGFSSDRMVVEKDNANIYTPGLDLSQFDRIQGNDVKFTVEWWGQTANHTGWHTLFSVGDGSAFGEGIFKIQMATDEHFVVWLMDEFDDFYGSRFSFAEETDFGVDIGYRVEVDIQSEVRPVAMYRTLDDGATWTLIGADHPPSVTFDGPGVGNMTDLTDVTVIVNGESTTSGNFAGKAERVKWTAHDGTSIVDIDIARDYAPLTDTVIDADGNAWTQYNTPTLGPLRDDNWFTAFGTTTWEWDLPTLDPVSYTLVARDVTSGTPGTSVEVSFTPIALELIDGSGNYFVRRGTGIYLWSAFIADTDNPTNQELREAIDVTCDVADFSGLNLNHEPIDLPRVTSSQDYTIPGVIQAQTPTLAMYDRVGDTSAFRDLFGAGATGFLILAPHGIVDAGDRVTVIPCTSAGNSDVWTVENQPATYIVSLTVTDKIRDTVVDYS